MVFITMNTAQTQLRELQNSVLNEQKVLTAKPESQWADLFESALDNYFYSSHYLTTSGMDVNRLRNHEILV